MVKEYYKKSFPSTRLRTGTASSRKYRSPSIYGATRREAKKTIKMSPVFVKLILLLIVVFLLIYYLFFSSQFRIKEIIIEGNSLVSKEDIESVLSQNQNIFLFKINQNRELILTKFPEISQAEIYRGIPDAIKIVVLERENKIVWQTNNEMYFVSTEGDVTRKIAQSEVGNLPIVSDTKNLAVKQGSRLVSPNFVAFITNIYSTFQVQENIKPVNFEVTETTFNVNLKTDAGFYIKLNSLRSSQKQLNDLKLILATNRPNIHEYVDLRIDGWAYYK
ncbi:MAG TPA: FtsQ-type POTRA domain-containing protein [Patescibacteria group bacterium]|nr:FtsQ-type POTRA domain-containing protein [Patescibacteria group bacterium]